MATSIRRIVTTEAESPEAELARLRAENDRLRTAAAPRPLTFRVSDKGGVSVYGMGRFPTTLYVEQWDRLIAQVDELRAFIESNRSHLRTKGEP